MGEVGCCIWRLALCVGGIGMSSVNVYIGALQEALRAVRGILEKVREYEVANDVTICKGGIDQKDINKISECIGVLSNLKR